jgi:hypothetical protein
MMQSNRLTVTTLVGGALAIAGWLPGRAWAQTSPPSSMPPGPPAGGASAGGASEASGWMLVAAIVVLIALIFTVVKLFDRRNRRRDEALSLQARVTDMLFLDPILGATPISVTVEAPLWPGSPTLLVVTGEVPRPEMRDAVRALVEREIGRTGRRVEMEDRVVVIPPHTVHAAA